MKTFVRLAVTLIAITVACQAGLVLAEDYYWVSGSDQTITSAGVEKEKAPMPGQSACEPCAPAACGCEQSCGACDSCCCHLGCEEGCNRVGIVGFAGLDSFKGIADGSFQSNFGAVTGLNVGTSLPGLDQYGIGWQTGLSLGLYDFDGRTSVVNDAARSQQQIFVTTGFFHKAKCDQRVSFGLVYDWMVNDQWGEYGAHPTLGQWRGQVEYALSGCNAVGFWGCARDLSASQGVVVGQRNAIVTNRAITQANLFWHHKFCCSGADSYLWLGVPDHGRLDGDGSLIDWTIGASVQVPLTCWLALYANGAYFHPSASAGAGAAVESGYDVGMGVVWYFGGGARSCAINGRCSDAYMPVANNSNFLVEQGFPVVR
jgi:hypothetical protein